MKKLSATYADLNFRLQLTRNQLMVDTIPTQESVTKYSHHLLAELETMGHQAKKKEVTTEPPKLKKFEEQSRDQGTKDNKEIGNKEKSKCRFYLSDSVASEAKDVRFPMIKKMRREDAGIVAALTTCLQHAQGLKKEKKV